MWSLSESLSLFSDGNRLYSRKKGRPLYVLSEQGSLLLYPLEKFCAIAPLLPVGTGYLSQSLRHFYRLPDRLYKVIKLVYIGETPILCFEKPEMTKAVIYAYQSASEDMIWGGARMGIPHPGTVKSSPKFASYGRAARVKHIIIYMPPGTVASDDRALGIPQRIAV